MENAGIQRWYRTLTTKEPQSSKGMTIKTNTTAELLKGIIVWRSTTHRKVKERCTIISATRTKLTMLLSWLFWWQHSANKIASCVLCHSPFVSLHEQYTNYSSWDNTPANSPTPTPPTPAGLSTASMLSRFQKQHQSPSCLAYHQFSIRDIVTLLHSIDVAQHNIHPLF